ncbi:MAG: GDYXXLXY domain-containing protein [Hyphomicrobiaceae bacterium]|nr:GDYXXLXY domain-containing protein [Hyphomicrobiaceae bacterium]
MTTSKSRAVTGAHAIGNRGASPRFAKFVRQRRIALLAAAALAQACVLGWMVWERETLLSQGREIALDVVPVDPRSLFRGDYVILSYEMSRIPAATLPQDIRTGDRVLIALAQRDGAWVVTGAGTPAKPPAAASAPGAVSIAGHVQHRTHDAWPSGNLVVRYGIESFFVPEGTGKEIEGNVAARKVIAHVALRRDGTAALKGLTVDGVRMEMPPLF